MKGTMMVEKMDLMAEMMVVVKDKMLAVLLDMSMVVLMVASRAVKKAATMVQLG